MRAIRAEFFFAFAVMGAILPYFPVFLKDRGLTDPEIGWVLSISGLAVLLTPVVVTLLADARMQNRTLLAWAFGLSAVALGWLWWAQGFWTIFAAHALYAVAFAAVIPLHDGLFFGEQQRREARGLAKVPYHRVRVFGTVGFIIPSLVLYVWLRFGAEVAVSLAAAGACCVLAMLNAPLLPASRSDEDAARPKVGLPTAEAFRAFTTRPLFVFVAASWLIHLAISAYYAFYPIYLTRLLGIDRQWIGLISNLGVLFEIFFVLAFGWIVKRIGVRGLMIAGSACMTLRFTLLWLIPSVPVAIATQVLHGMMVLVVHVAPPVYLDRHANPSYRNSIQGLFAMICYGTGRIAGNAVAGYVAADSLTGVFGYAAVLSAAVLVLFVLLFREDDDSQSREGREAAEKAGPAE